MSDTGTPPKMVMIQTADGVSLTKFTPNLEYDIGVHVLCFNYGVPIGEVLKMDRDVVRRWGRNRYAAPKETHCHECGQTIPEE